MKGFLRLRGKTYYFRCWVPLDLQEMFSNRTEIVKSLHTREKNVAKEAAAEWYSRTTRIFNLCRFKSIPHTLLSELIQSELFPPKQNPVQPESRRLRDLFDDYIRDHKVNWREKSYDEVAYSLELAVEVIGNIPTCQLTPDVIKSYLATILLLPANHRKKPALRNLRVREIVKLAGLTPMSHKSVCKHMQWLGAALKHAKLEYLLDGLILPTITRNAHEERSVYDREELQRILDNLKWDEAHPDRLWVPLIGLLQGMRLNEICQLHVQDVCLEGTPNISINDDAGKQVKNAESYRRIPVHLKLIDLGFLDYVRAIKATRETRLFPMLKPHRGAYGHYTGKWFQTFNRKHITPDPKKVFHSLRHGFIDHLANNTEAKEHQIAWLVGHSNQKSQTAGRYTKPPSPAQLLPIMEMYDVWMRLQWTAAEAEARKGTGRA